MNANAKPNAKQVPPKGVEACRCGDARPEAKTIRCRRVDAAYTPEEHATCPYCFGRLAEIQGGDYAKFCDFKPGEDPISFGFPTDCGRFAH